MATVIQTSTVVSPDGALVAAIPFMFHVTRQSISNLVTSILLIIAGGVGFSNVGGYMLGILSYYHPFWIGGIMIIACSLGIATYTHGRYRKDTAIPHLVFVILAMLASIGGIVISSINVANLARLVRYNSAYIGGLCTNIATLLIYIGFFSTSIYQIVVYSRISRMASNVQAPQGMMIVGQQQYTNQTGYVQPAGYQPQVMQPPMYNQQPTPIEQKGQGF